MFPVYVVTIGFQTGNDVVRTDRNRASRQRPPPPSELAGLTAETERAIDRAERALFAHSRRRDSGAANSLPTRRSKPTTSCCSSGCTSREGAAGIRPRRARIDRAARSHPGATAAGWRLQHLYRRTAEVSATVKATARSSSPGILPDSDPLRRARERILALGGLQAANSYVKINLSLFGLYPRKYVPTRAAGDRHAAGQRALRNVVVDALHPGAALDRAGARIQPARAGRIHAGRTPAAGCQPALPETQRA